MVRRSAVPSPIAAATMVSSYLSVSSAGQVTPATVVAILIPMGASSTPGTTAIRERDDLEATDAPWVTIVWDDPVNLMNYVTYVLQKLFGYSEPHATKLMLQVHNEGRAVVSAGTREAMEADVAKLHAAGLWATLQQDR